MVYINCTLEGAVCEGTVVVINHTPSQPLHQVMRVSSLSTPSSQSFSDTKGVLSLAEEELDY